MFQIVWNTNQVRADKKDPKYMPLIQFVDFTSLKGQKYVAYDIGQNY